MAGCFLSFYPPFCSAVLFDSILLLVVPFDAKDVSLILIQIVM